MIQLLKKLAVADDDDNGIIKKKVKKLEERIELAKMKIGALLDAKDKDIWELKQLVIQQKEITRQEQEKVEELEEYIRFQEE